LLFSSWVVMGDQMANLACCEDKDREEERARS
jgi:hypothetical protein